MTRSSGTIVPTVPGGNEIRYWTSSKMTHRCIIIPLFLLAFALPLAALASDESANITSGSKLPEAVSSADALAPAGVTAELGFDAHHVQGLLVTRDHFYFTSVDTRNIAAWIFKLDRDTLEILASAKISRYMDFHPGGIDFDGKRIWVPVAVYEPHTHTNMMIVDPVELRSKRVFEVDDHIGAVSRYKDVVIGANWNARQFYFWTLKGELIEKRDNPTGVGYQDCKAVGDFLACCGGGYLDWIDIRKWKLAKRFPAGKSIEESSLSHEGVAYFEGHAYFLPDDGEKARIYKREFVKSGE